MTVVAPVVVWGWGVVVLIPQFFLQKMTFPPTPAMGAIPSTVVAVAGVGGVGMFKIGIPLSFPPQMPVPLIAPGPTVPLTPFASD